MSYLFERRKKLKNISEKMNVSLSFHACNVVEHVANLPKPERMMSIQKAAPKGNRKSPDQQGSPPAGSANGIAMCICKLPRKISILQVPSYLILQSHISIQLSKKNRENHSWHQTIVQTLWILESHHESTKHKPCRDSCRSNNGLWNSRS